MAKGRSYQLRSCSKMRTVEVSSSSDESKSTPSDESDIESDEELHKMAKRVAAEMSNVSARDLRTGEATSQAANRSSGFIIDKTPSSNVHGDNLCDNYEPDIAEDGGAGVSDNRGNCSEDSSDDDGEEQLSKAAETSGTKTEGKTQFERLQLSSALQVDLDTDLYVDLDNYKTTSRRHVGPSNTRDSEILKKSVITPDFEKKDIIPPFREGIRLMKKKRKAEREMTKGNNWFDMKAPDMTEEKKNDLLVLQYRNSLDPKRFYKALDLKTLPKYFQIAKVVDNPADFYHSRIPKKQRKRTLVDELLADADFRRYNKKKYTEVMLEKSNQTGAYKKMKFAKKLKKK